MGRHTQKAKPVQGVSLQKIINKNKLTKQTWRNNYKTTCTIHNIKLNTMTTYKNNYQRMHKWWNRECRKYFGFGSLRNGSGTEFHRNTVLTQCWQRKNTDDSWWLTEVDTRTNDDPRIKLRWTNFLNFLGVDPQTWEARHLKSRSNPKPKFWGFAGF